MFCDCSHSALANKADMRMQIFDDEEYKRVVIPDELKFIDRPNCMFFPVNFATIFERESPK